MKNLLKVNTTFNLFKICAICFIMLLSTSFFSQNEPLKSNKKISSLNVKITEEVALAMTKNFIAKNEYQKAVDFLEKHYQKFSNNLVINWLFAHAYSLNGDKKRANNKFQKAISLAPENRELQMDYTRFLYGLGKIDKAIKTMNNFVVENSKNVEVLLMQANISFWKRDIKNARKKIAIIKEFYPNTDITKSLENEITNTTATYIKSNFEFQTDSQPLEYFANHIFTGKFISCFLSPQLEVSKYNFSPQKEGALTLKLSNQFYFDKLKLAAKFTFGAYINDSDETDWIGDLSFTKNLFKNASLNFGYAKNALLGTIASTTFNLTQQDLFGVLDYNNKYIVLNAAYNHKFFEDENVITSISAWMVSQPIKIKKIGFQLGYGYSFTDSENILFISDNQGSGIYDPYFTPKDQGIHSALLITSYQPTKKITLRAKLNYGIQATVQNPYVIEIASGAFDIGGFYKADFNYTEINGSFEYAVSKNFSINANYVFQETFFYTRDNYNLGLNFTF
ncbi:MAG: hypothetical protein P8P15_00365 [Polaribacter sp.]|nr:hypothetical protein [Polaribacter sp.]